MSFTARSHNPQRRVGRNPPSQTRPLRVSLSWKWLVMIMETWSVRCPINTMQYASDLIRKSSKYDHPGAFTGHWVRARDRKPPQGLSSISVAIADPSEPLPFSTMILGLWLARVRRVVDSLRWRVFFSFFFYKSSVSSWTLLSWLIRIAKGRPI